MSREPETLRESFIELRDALKDLGIAILEALGFVKKSKDSQGDSGSGKEGPTL